MRFARGVSAGASALRFFPATEEVPLVCGLLVVPEDLSVFCWLYHMEVRITHHCAEVENHHHSLHWPPLDSFSALASCRLLLIFLANRRRLCSRLIGCGASSSSDCCGRMKTKNQIESASRANVIMFSTTAMIWKEALMIEVVSGF